LTTGKIYIGYILLETFRQRKYGTSGSTSMFGNIRKNETIKKKKKKKKKKSGSANDGAMSGDGETDIDASFLRPFKYFSLFRLKPKWTAKPSQQKVARRKH
jgi:hypothetical protein